MNLSINDRWKILLIDHNPLKQQIRTAVLRNCEVEVHTAESLADASTLWARCSYDLILLAAEESSHEALCLCNEVRKNKPKQRIALLVGAPQYVREIGRRPRVLQPTLPRPHLEIMPQPTQWEGTLQQLLAVR